MKKESVLSILFAAGLVIGVSSGSSPLHAAPADQSSLQCYGSCDCDWKSEGNCSLTEESCDLHSFAACGNAAGNCGCSCVPIAKGAGELEKTGSKELSR